MSITLLMLLSQTQNSRSRLKIARYPLLSLLRLLASFRSI